jgi:hypothetical protein
MIRAMDRTLDRRKILARGIGAAAAVWGWPGRGAAARAIDDPVLRTLVARNHDRDPQFRRGLSNHLSMALFSMASLGGGSKRLQAVGDAIWPSLEPFPTGGPAVTAANWTALRGNHAALPGLRAFFRAEIARAGVGPALRKVLPELLPGLGAAAFHGIIRTGYGVRFGDDAEVADGLAYWAIAYLPLGPLAPATSRPDPIPLLEKVRATASLAGAKLKGGLIFDQMEKAAALPGFSDAASALAPRDDSLAQLSLACGRLYVATADFTALHAVTGTHAYRLLEPFIVDRAAGVRHLWQALVAAYITIGAPKLDVPTASAPPGWDALTRRATESTDAHDLKLVDVAREQHTFYREPIFQRAAARRLA